jgi:hypothetical protein
VSTSSENRGHEAVERLDIDADRLASYPFARLGVGALGGRGRVADRGQRPNIGPHDESGGGRAFLRAPLCNPLSGRRANRLRRSIRSPSWPVGSR